LAPFTHSLSQVEALEPLLSPDRLEPYLKFCARDKVRAFKLHEANRMLSQAIYGSLQYAELALRNSLSRQLALGLKADAWYDQQVFAEPERRQIIKAKNYLSEESKTVTPPRMVAVLSLGFWVGLLRGSYARTLWNPCLHKAFAANPSLKHKDAHDRFASILSLRNRVAHHEPIFFRHRDLLLEVDRIAEALGWIDPVAAQWCRDVARLEVAAAYDLARKLAAPLPA